MNHFRKTIVLALFLLFAGAAGQAAVCITFGNSVDNFEGEITASRNGYFTMSLFETLFNRAAAGAAHTEGDTFYMGWTKNTNTATVAYQCDVNTLTLTGPCNINVFTTVPDGSERLTDVATVESGNCSAVADAGTPALGETAD